MKNMKLLSAFFDKTSMRFSAYVNAVAPSDKSCSDLPCIRTCPNECRTDFQNAVALQCSSLVSPWLFNLKAFLCDTMAFSKLWLIKHTVIHRMVKHIASKRRKISQKEKDLLIFICHCLKCGFLQRQERKYDTDFC